MEPIQSVRSPTGSGEIQSTGHDRQTDPVALTLADDLAYFNCPATNQSGWLPRSLIRLPIDDLGFRQGVTAVERMRTYGGRVFLLDRHLKRLSNTLDCIGLRTHFAIDSVEETIHELLLRNLKLVQSVGDVGITVWITPDSNAVHLNSLDHTTTARRRVRGQPVVLTGVVQPSRRTWSRQAKVRSRLHYYLADQHARSIATDATGVLQDEDGSWTETSIANIALICGTTITFPPADQVLHGVTQSFVEEIAGEIGIDVNRTELWTGDMVQADTVALMGTDGGLWFASEVFGPDGTLLRACEPPSETSVIRKLQQRMPSTDCGRKRGAG